MFRTDVPYECNPCLKSHPNINVEIRTVIFVNLHIICVFSSQFLDNR